MAHTLRRLLRSPLFTGLTLLTLAIGIGANTAIFSVIEGVLIKPLPYPNPDRLIAIWHTAPGISITQLPCAPSNWFTYREESRTFEDVGIWRNDTNSVTGLAEPEEAALLTADGRTASGSWEFSRPPDGYSTAGILLQEPRKRWCFRTATGGGGSQATSRPSGGR